MGWRLRRRSLALARLPRFIADANHVCERTSIMAGALGLIERVIWDPRGDEGAVIVVAGTVAVETDFPRCGEHDGQRICTGLGTRGG